MAWPRPQAPTSVASRRTPYSGAPLCPWRGLPGIGFSVEFLILVDLNGLLDLSFSLPLTLGSQRRDCGACLTGDGMGPEREGHLPKNTQLARDRPGTRTGSSGHLQTEPSPPRAGGEDDQAQAGNSVILASRTQRDPPGRSAAWWLPGWGG